MTAIIIGRLKKANFIVVDSMVQLELSVKSYKECRLQDKISDIDLTTQFLTLSGEGLIADGASLLNHWSVIKKIPYDLFNKNHFENVLELALRHRQFHIHMGSPIIAQDQSEVYIVSRKEIKNYTVKFIDSKFKIINETMIPEDSVLINYKGNIKPISLPEVGSDLIKFGIAELYKEHLRRKTEGLSMGQKALEYEFEDRFSSVLMPNNESLPIDRQYPYKHVTDMFLAQTPDWEFLTSPSFAFTPKT